MRSIEQIIRLVCGYLNDSGVPYVIVGGFAVMYHGRPRATADIDLLISIGGEDLSSFVDFLKNNGFFASEEDMREAFREKSHCTVEDKETMFRLDIKGIYTTEEQRTLDNRIFADLDGIRLYLASAEDTILSKLLWGRERDILDSLSIYVRRKDELDMEYLKKEAKKQGTLERLEALVESAERYEEDLQE